MSPAPFVGPPPFEPSGGGGVTVSISAMDAFPYRGRVLFQSAFAAPRGVLGCASVSIIDHLRKQFEQHEIRRVKIGGFDIDCILRGKYVSLEKFWSIVENGMGFCDVIFGWDSTDVL